MEIVFFENKIYFWFDIHEKKNPIQNPLPPPHLPTPSPKNEKNIQETFGKNSKLNVSNPKCR